MTEPTPTSGLPPLPAWLEVQAEVCSSPVERTFRAFDRRLEREVFLKLPASALWDGWTAPVRARLLREAKALAKVRHPGVAPILSVEETAAGPLLVLEPPEGELLAERLATGPLDVDAAQRLGVGLAEALAAVHYQGIVHRAVGSESVRLLPDGGVQLGSFTFAKEFDARPGGSSIDYRSGQEPRLARAMPPYPAPEQILGQGADARSDVYALGCLLYRCLAGREPSEGTGREDLPTDLRQLRRDVPKALAEIVRRCMHPARTARYPTAQAVADALKGALVRERPRSRRWLAAAGIAAAALLALAFQWLVGGATEPRGAVHPVDPAVTPGTLAPRYDQLHALLIAIADAYRGTPWTALANPEREVLEVRNRLRSLDDRWQVQLLTGREATKKAIVSALSDLRKGVLSDGRRVLSDDAVLVYFAGHGAVRSQSERYWLVPADVSTPGPDPDESSYVSREDLLDLFGHCPAKHVLLVLDCCFAGLVQEVERGRPAGGSAGPTADPAGPFLRERAFQTIVSTGKDHTARDGEGPRSPFCDQFLRALDPEHGPNAGMRFVTAGKVAADVQAWMTASPGAGGTAGQVPALRTHHGTRGDFVFYLRRP